jgi:hypothetical protein
LEWAKSAILSAFFADAKNEKWRIQKSERSNMARSNLLGLAVVLSVAMVGVAETASAAPKAKKLSYDQASAECRKDVAFLGNEVTTSAGRYTRAAGCMMQHGHRM